MNVTIGRGQNHAGMCRTVTVLSFVDIGLQQGYGILHDLGRFHHLRQEHLSLAKQLADMFHRLHQRLFDDIDGATVFCQCLRDVLRQVFADTLAQGIGQTLLDGFGAPISNPAWRTCGLTSRTGEYSSSEGDEAFGGTVVGIQNDILYGLKQRGFDVIVDLQHARVDDGHIQSFADGMIEEYGMHGLAYLIITTETERQIADATAGLGQRQVFLDPTHGTDEINAVGLMFLQTSTHAEDIDIEDDILSRKSDACQQLVGPFCNSNLTFVGGCLSLLVEGHHHHCRSQPTQFTGLANESLLTVLQTDGIDDALSLCILQTSQNGVPIAGVNHQH